MCSWFADGAPVLFTGLPSAGAATLPLIRNTFVGSFTAFEVIVTDLLIGPAFLVLYFTVIFCVTPGAIGSFGHSGTVHPHEPFALEIINGSLPVFVNSNVQVPLPPFLTFP